MFFLRSTWTKLITLKQYSFAMEVIDVWSMMEEEEFDFDFESTVFDDTGYLRR